jgi:hypothetical protein
VAHVARAQEVGIVLDQVGHIHEDLIEAEALASRVPGEGCEEGIQVFGGVSKRGQVLAEEDNKVRT